MTANESLPEPAAFDCDVLIVGSGPSGASTALHLARLAPQLRLLVVERGHHPRPKLCGGGLVADADICLHNLGLDVREVAHIDAQWANLHYRGVGNRMRLGAIAFHVVRRLDFDRWLVDKVRAAGVEIREGLRVRGVAADLHGAVVDTDRGPLRARVVVGADGSKSVVRRAVAQDTGPVARLLELVTPPPAPGRVPEAEAIFEFAWAPRGVQGYFWSFPTEVDGRPMRNWGVYDSRIAPRPSGGSLKEVLREALAAYGLDLDDHHLEGHPIRLFDPRGELARPSVLLVGDAAGADAAFGEGISPALGYGELAAAAVVDAFARRDFTFAGYRRLVLRSPLGRSLVRRARLARLVYGIESPAAHALLWRHLGPLLRWVVRAQVFNWARPTRPPPALQGRASGPAPVAPYTKTCSR